MENISSTETKTFFHNRFVIWIAIIAALCGLLFGFDTGVIAGAILFINKQFHLTPLATEIVVSSVLMGACMGAVFSGKAADLFGRRYMMFTASIAFISGTVLSALAWNLISLMTGRFIVGIAIGMASYIAPLYISEIAPAKNRGALVILNTITVTGGMVVAYLVDLSFGNSGAWRWMLGIGVIPALFLFVGLLFLPHSPRWMAQQGWLQRARYILDKIRPKHEVENEIEEIQKSLEAESNQNWKKLFSRPFIKVLLLGCFLAALQQFTGINTILYYAPMIFKLSGFQSNTAALIATLGMGLTNFVMTIVAMWLVDKVGRRKLLLTGLSVMSLSLIATSIAFHLNLSLSLSKYILFLSLIFFIAFYALSIGCLFWLIISEIYPLKVRGLAMSLATLCNWGSNLLVAITFLSFLNYFGKANTFGLYALISLVSVFICYFFVPETKNISLEKIEMDLKEQKRLKNIGA